MDVVSRATRHNWHWEAAGAPYGGTVTSVAISPNVARDRTCFAATMAGLYRSPDLGVTWQREPSGFTGLSLTAVAVSPAFAGDGLVLVAGLECGVFRLRGGQWLPGTFGGRPVRAVALAISPAFDRDGICFAATMADGVFRSQDRGAHWGQCTFGLLDLDVIALAISPEFERDEMVVAATATGLFRSPNGGRAWRELALPTEGVAILCVAFSPAFGQDGVLFAGTDGAGLFRSPDRGASWQAVPGPWAGHAINGIALSPAFAADRLVMLATDMGVYVSRDGGENWSVGTATAGALCVAVAPTAGSGGPLLAGLSRAGIERAGGDGTAWHPANEGLAGRLLTDLVPSPTFAADRRLAAYGAGEGVLCSEDGGRAWTQADDALPSLQVTSVVVAVAAGGKQHLFAALLGGIWTCAWETLAWEQIGDLAAHALALSPAFEHDAMLFAGTADGQLWVTGGGAAPWRRIDVPWEQRKLLALSVSLQDGKHRLQVVLGDPHVANLSIWEGAPDGVWEQRGQYECAASVARVAPVGPDGAWYVAAADRVIGPFAAGAGQPRVSPLPDAEQPAILDLAVVAEPGAAALLAASTRGLYYRRADNQDWAKIDQEHHAGPIVALAVTDERAGGQVLALEVGGALWRLSPVPRLP